MCKTDESRTCTPAANNTCSLKKTKNTFSLETGRPAGCHKPRGGWLPGDPSGPTPECVRTHVCVHICARVCMRGPVFMQEERHVWVLLLQEKLAVGTGSRGPGLPVGHRPARGSQTLRAKELGEGGALGRDPGPDHVGQSGGTPVSLAGAVLVRSETTPRLPLP